MQTELLINNFDDASKRKNGGSISLAIIIVTCAIMICFGDYAWGVEGFAVGILLALFQALTFVSVYAASLVSDTHVLQSFIMN